MTDTRGQNSAYERRRPGARVVAALGWCDAGVGFFGVYFRRDGRGDVDRSARTKDTRKMPPSDDDEATMRACTQATNVFVRENGAWRIVHHHAEPAQPARARTISALN